MNFKEYLIENQDIIGLKKRMQIKSMNLEYRSHNIWENKKGDTFKWDEKTKKFISNKKQKEESKPIEAYGIKGMNSTRWRKTFKNSDALSKWVDANDAEVLGYGL